MLYVCHCRNNNRPVLISSVMANKRANTLSLPLLNTSAALILQNVKPLEFVIAMMRACQRWWVLLLGKNRYLLKMPSFYVSKPNNP